MSTEISPDAEQVPDETTGYLRIGWPGAGGITEVPWERPWPPPELVVVIKTAQGRFPANLVAVNSVDWISGLTLVPGADEAHFYRRVGLHPPPHEQPDKLPTATYVQTLGGWTSVNRRDPLQRAAAGHRATPQQEFRRVYDYDRAAETRRRYELARSSALSSTQIERRQTVELTTSYGYIVLYASEAGAEDFRPDYTKVAQADEGSLWMRVGMDTMPVQLTVKVLPIGLLPMDRPGTEVVYDGSITVGEFESWNSSMPLAAGDNSGLGAIPFRPRPFGQWQVRVQVMGREESRRIGEEWLDLAPDDHETPWPEHPDAVEHWWIVFYRLTWPHSGTVRPDEEDIKDLVGVESDYEPDEHYGPQHIEVVGGGPAMLRPAVRGGLSSPKRTGLSLRRGIHSTTNSLGPEGNSESVGWGPGTLMNDNGFHSTSASLPPVAGRHRNHALAAARRTRAVQLRTQGWTYEAIARQLGYASRATVFAIVRKALDAHEAEEVARHRSLERARLDRLQASLWGRAMTGDVAAAGQARLIIETRIRLLGLLEKMPQEEGGCSTVVCTCPRGIGHRQQSLLGQE